MMKRLSAIFLAILHLLLGLCGCGKSQSSVLRDPDTVLREMLSDYGAHACLSDARTEQALAELSAADSRLGERWAGILEYWRYVNNELPVNCGALPDDLPDDDTLCIIVLGYQLNADGSMQDELIERLKVAQQCAKQYPNAYVLCTGGRTAMAGIDVSEGERMGQWLLKNGLDKKRLLIEGDSLTTAQNALFSYALLQKRCPQVETAAIVTSSYHIPWGALMFETVFRLNAEDDVPAVKLAAHSAYETFHTGFGVQENLRCQTSGMLEIADVFRSGQRAE